MKKLLLLSLILLLTLSLHAQLRPEDSFREVDRTPLKVWSEEKGFQLKGVEIIGSPYVREDFQPAVFTFNDGGKYGLEARLNTSTNTFEVLFDSQVHVLPNSNVKSVDYYGCSYQVKEFNNQAVLLKEVMVENDAALFVLRLTRIEDGRASNGYTEELPEAYRDLSPIYFIETKGKLISLSRMKNLYKAMPERAREIKSFVKKKKLDTDKLDDITQILQFITA